MSNHKTQFLFIDSPVLTPGWRYNLNLLTDIKATADYLALDEKVKGCSLESKENCSSNSYVKRVTKLCGCLPLSTRTRHHSKVAIFPSF